MTGIKNVQFQNAVTQNFSLIVINGASQEEYSIQEPDGFNDINVIVDVNEEYFNVDNFILGESTKIKFLEYNDKKTFDLIKSIYDKKGGDGQIFFKWVITKLGKDKKIFDILGDDFELNLNKYKLSYEQSGRVIELEIKKREAQNKFLTREDITINLFANKNIDGNPIDKVEIDKIILKTENQETKAFWYLDAWNLSLDKKVEDTNLIYSYVYEAYRNYKAVVAKKLCFFPRFVLSEKESDFGANTHSFRVRVSEKTTFVNPNIPNDFSYISYKEFHEATPVLIAENDMSGVVISLSNFEFRGIYIGLPLHFSLRVEKEIDGEITTIMNFMAKQVGDTRWSEIKFTNIEKELGDLKKGTKIYISFYSRHYDLTDIGVYAKNPHPSVKIYYKIDKPSRKSNTVSLFNGLSKVVENYTDNKIKLRSSILSNGAWKSQKIATGFFLRGVANIILVDEKINASFKSLFYDGSAPLLGLGFDIVDEDLIIEDIGYFYKPIISTDFSNKDFVQESLIIENDLDISYNHLIFGTKKFSTKKKGDLKNFNTQMECVTPIKSVKKKFDKTTDFIIDEYKIRDLLADKTTQTNDNDDDIVLLDTIEMSRYTDKGVLSDITHHNESGALVLKADDIPWDVFPYKVGSKIRIVAGLNLGEWTITNLSLHSMFLDKKNNIQTGKVITKLEYDMENVTKNRNGNSEDFNDIFNITNIESKDIVTNIVHNPRYHAKRWFSFYGSGLTKKSNEDFIKVSNYKNNGNVTISKGTSIETLNHELPLSELRDLHNGTFFNGETIEITLTDINFDEFYACYHNWRYGADYNEEKENNNKSTDENKDRDNFIKTNRGLIKVKVLDKYIYLYPFGPGAFDYDKGYRELTLRGKIHKYENAKKIFDYTFDESFE